MRTISVFFAELHGSPQRSSYARHRLSAQDATFFWTHARRTRITQQASGSTAGNSINVQKKRARPKRSNKTPGEDHELGLWIDYDLLRKHQSRLPQIVIHDPVIGINDRYLELADIALRGGKSRYRVAQSER